MEPVTSRRCTSHGWKATKEGDSAVGTASTRLRWGSGCGALSSGSLRGLDALRRLVRCSRAPLCFLEGDDGVLRGTSPLTALALPSFLALSSLRLRLCLLLRDLPGDRASSSMFRSATVASAAVEDEVCCREDTRGRKVDVPR